MVRVSAGIGYALTEAMTRVIAVCRKKSSDRWRPAPGNSRRSDPDGAGTGTGRRHGGRRHRGGNRPAYSSATVPGRAAIAGHLLGIAAGKPPWPDIDPGKALPWMEAKTGHAPGRSASRLRYARRSPLKVSVITGGPGVGKTDDRQLDPAHPVRQERRYPAVRADRSRREADERGHRVRGQDDPPPARGRPQERRVPARCGHPLDCGLLVVDETSDGGRHADAGAACGGPRRSCTADRGRCRSAALGGGRARFWPTSSPSGAVPVVRLTEVFRQAAQSRIVTTATGSTGARSPDLSGPRATATSISCRPRIPRRRPLGSLSWSRPASRNASGSMPCRTSRCCAR